MLIFGIMLTIIAAVLLICRYCYRVAFYVPPRKERPADFIDLPRERNTSPSTPR